MAATVPCPKCRQPLEIPKPMPDKIRCPGCGATIKKGAKAPAGQSAQAGEAAARRPAAEDRPSRGSPGDKSPADSRRSRTSPETPSSNTGVKVGIAAAVLLVAIGGGAAAWWLNQNPSPPATVEKDGKTKKVEKTRSETEGKTTEEEKTKEEKTKEEKSDNNPEKVKDPKKDPPVEVVKLSRPEQLKKDIRELTKKLAAAENEDDKEKIRQDLASLNKELNDLKAPPDPRVTKAVDAGVKYLRSRTPSKDATFADGDPNVKRYSVGAAALIGLTLLECDVPPGDPDIQAIANSIRASASQMKYTYEIAPAIFFLDRLSKPKDEDDKTPSPDQKLIQSLALRLILFQNKEGLWTYFNTNPAQSVTDDQLMAELAGNTYQPRGLGRGDISNTQFAALALWMAGQRHGVPVGPPLRAAAKTVRSTQDGGSWSYGLGSGAGTLQHRDTGTCVGLILMALGRAVDENEGKAKGAPAFIKDPQVVSALKYLSKVVHKSTGKGSTLGADSQGDLYFLWTLERMSLILKQEKIDGVDWHAWGTEYLLDKQNPADGSWNDKYGGPVDTCFALLFLKRVDLFKELGDKLQFGMLSTPGSQLAAGPPLPRRDD